MAQIRARNDISMMKIRSFLGLNENPDGDTTLKTGEMAEMRNFRITQDGHLQIRPGSRTVADLAGARRAIGGAKEGKTAVRGVWHGVVGSTGHTLCAWGGYIWDVNVENGACRSLGTAADEETSFFGFGGKVYLLNGQEYKSWDGGSTTKFETVVGYIPVVQTATTPGGNGTLLEPVNRLCGLRRVQFSPDGKADTFTLPERNISAVAAVFLNGTLVSGYTQNLSEGTVKMQSVPPAGTNTLEITYRKGTGDRAAVERMRFAELFNGSTDTRVFLYGDGSNRCVYSGVEYATGRPSAEYFPDLYEIHVGESNTPVTALVRHYSRLMAFKTGSAWVIQYGTIGLADSTTTAAFYVQPVNRQFGNEAMGQVRLLENDPLTLDAGGIYQWKGAGYAYGSGAESSAKRLSDRVVRSLSRMDCKRVKTANMKWDREYWFLLEGRALILNYANDSWYLYEDLPFQMALEIDNEKYGFGDDGKVVHFSKNYRNDDGRDIDCYAATGAMDFDRDWLQKYSPMIFVALQPESGARIYVTVETNRKSGYPEKLVAYGIATFLHMNFAHFSFGTNRKPQVKRVKMKVKKATFYRLIFKSKSASATATVIETDVRLRYAGAVK